MFYINKTGPNHGNPQSNPFNGSVELSDSLLRDYIQTMGFANLTLDGDTVTGVSINQEAYDSYKAEHPVVPPEPTVDEVLNTLLGVTP